MASTTFSGPVTSTNGFIGAVTGNITGNVTGNVTGDIFATNQALSGAGAVNVTDMLTSLTTTGAAAVLTPTTKIGFTTITFTNVGDSATLVYTAAGWAIIGISGAVAA